MSTFDDDAPPGAEKMESLFVSVRAKDVVIVKGLVEAHEGVGQVYAEKGGSLELVAPSSRMPELREIAHALDEEFNVLLRPPRDRAE